jgi:hypothetical protein
MPGFSPDRGGVILDQPQRIRTTQVLRLICDIAALRHVACVSGLW